MTGHGRRRGAAVLTAALLVVWALTVPAAVAAPERAATQARAVHGTCTPGARACPIRISFAAGAYSGQRSSTLTGISSGRWFVVRAAAGQQMIVIVQGAGPTRGQVFFRNGVSEGQPGGRIFDGEVPVSGDVLIRATESQMAEAWRGRVTVVVVIW